ncbi:MAG: hypothetical protein DWP94_03635 [Flavobacterium sp.]|nr:MAG: hypothetical protein DWP94_03635 [Flavobacterium sp.]
MRAFLVFSFLFISLSIAAQKTPYISVDTDRFGADSTHKLLVWHPSELHLDLIKNKKEDSVLFGNRSLTGKALEQANSYNILDTSGIYEREELVWKTQTDREEELEYITSWLTKRLEFLDMYFKKE